MLVPMLVIDAAKIASLLTPKLVREALREAFCAPIEVPVRHHHSIHRSSTETATLLLMPAWSKVGGVIGVKIATVFPENARRNAPSVEASYLLMSGDTGTPLAVMDGRAITLWRTASASALAAGYLARTDASRLLIVGAGAMAPYLIAAHADVRPITHVEIWNRDRTKAEVMAQSFGGRINGRVVTFAATADLETAVAAADIVSAATLSSEPLIKGAWLKPGTHVDLVGGFTPKMREADDDVIRRATIFVDTKGGALKEAGDLTQPLAAGVMKESDVAADLFDLCRAVHTGRKTPDEITFFKSVGTAIEDLAAAALVYGRIDK